MKRIGMAAAFVAVVALGGCSDTSADSAFGSAGGGSDAAAGGATPGKNAGLGAPGEASDESAPSEETAAGSQAQSGLLTAGVWDDNLNFDFFKKFVSLSEPTLDGLPSFSATERDAAKQKWAQRVGSTELDIAFLIDTTSSMGDELSYLQNEIDGIVLAIKSKYPQTTPRFGLVVYRDRADEYLTRPFDFTSLELFRANLAKQKAGGGGDYPEAVGDGLEQVTTLSWRPGAVTRMTFWVADAPHHVNEATTVKTAIDAAAAKDVHLYPVASSGTDPRAEFTMRSAAQLTGGRYIFLTDDSGVGNSHAEPNIPCYHVTKFDGALVRMVESEMSGTHVQPKAEEILRTVGNPQNGQCATKARGNVSIY